MKKLIPTLVTLFLITACTQNESGVKVSNEQQINACSEETKECPDGRSVKRNPNKNCEFDSCQRKKIKATPMMCTADTKQCPDGSYVGRDHYNNCKFKACPPTNNGRDIK